MSSPDKQWQKIRDAYIHEVRKALADSSHPRKKEVVDDVAQHLQQRYEQLSEADRSSSAFNAIVAEMGPASEYVELLDVTGETTTQKLRHSKRRWMWAALGLVLLVAIGFAVEHWQTLKFLAATGQLRSGKFNAEFASKLAEGLNQLDIDVADAFTVIDLLGEPKACVWGKEVLDMTDLPDRHVMIYPNGFHVFIAYGKIIEIRFEDPASGYRWHDQLAIGDSLEKALEVVGTPRKTVVGQENTFEDGVLYRDIEGRSGHDYYARWDLDVRLWFVNDQVRAIYVTRSDYHDGPSSGELSLENLPVTSTINEQGHIVDKVDYPFVNDPNVLGYWRSVDFVDDMNDFKPDRQQWGGELFLKELYVFPEGKTNWAWSWTQGLLLHAGNKTASAYCIREMGSERYLFLEWKSGDYTIRHCKPAYYVLKKEEDQPFVETRVTDKIDYPFVDDPNVIGTWITVSFVETPEEFDGTACSWRDQLYLKQLEFLPEGKMPGDSQTWTRGLVIHHGNKTASRYSLKAFDNDIYMFFEWKSGDYTLRRLDPEYYVLKKQ